MDPRLPLALAALAAAGACRGPAREPAARHIVLGQITSAVTLDPHGQDQAQTSITLSHFYETLVGFGPEMELRPLLALRWENPSETLWRFHLRPGVVFHDGRTFSASDAAASLSRALLPESHVRYYVQAIDELRVVDDLTLELTTRHPAPVLLNALVFVPIVPRDTGRETIVRPVGTGPYSFVGGRPGGAIVGQRFPRYWGQAPAFDQVTILPMPDVQDRATAVATGRADIVSQFPNQYWLGRDAQPGVRRVYRQGLGCTLLGFSLAKGSAFADPRLRRAIALGIDRERLVREGVQGLGTAIEQIVPPSVVGYSTALPAAPTDRDSARRQIAAFRLPEIPIVIPDAHEDVGRALVQQLQELGLRLNVSVLAQKDFYDRWSQEEFPLSVFGWASSTGDASGAFEPLLHSPVEGYGRFNRFSFKSPRLDRLIEAADSAPSSDERREMLDAAARIVREELPVIPLVGRYDLYAARADLEWRPRLDRRVRAFEVRPLAAAP